VPHPGHPRRAATVLELAVATAIVLVIVGLLLPAIQKVREASARTACTNHLRQIGTACHGYHDARGRFPSLGAATADPAADFARRDAEWTWAYQLLPHLAQPALYRNPDPAVVCRTPVAVFFCPARRPPTAVNGAARIDYAGNAGTTPDATDGVIVPAARGTVRLADIADGATGTVLAGGKRLNGAALGATADDDEAYPAAGWKGDYEVYRTGAAAPARDATDPAETAPRSNFGAAHPGVFNAAFCDGSVRTLRYGVDPDLWRRSCARNTRLAPVPSEE